MKIQIKSITAFSILLSSILSAQTLSQNLSDGLTNCMSFDGNLYDNVSTLSSSPFNAGYDYITDKNGKSNAALEFDNANAIKSIGIPSSTTKPNLWTVSMWIKPYQPATGVTQFLYDRGSSGGDQAITITNTAIGIVNYLASGSVKTLASTTLPTDFFNQWHHIVAMKKTDSLVLYVDGVKNSAVYNNVNTSYYGTSTSPLENIGVRFNSTGYYSGDIDEFRRYNGALTKAEIDSLYTYYALPVTKVKASNTLDVYMALDGSDLEQVSNVLNGITLNYGNDKKGNNNSAAKLQNATGIKQYYNGPLTTNWSVSMWAYTRSNTLNTQYNLFSVGSVGGGEQSAYFINDKIYVLHSTSTTAGYALQSNSSVSTGSWHHIVAMKKQDSLVLYIDGVRDMASLCGNTFSYGADSPPSVYIGSKANNTFVFDGYIDQFRRYNRELTKSEIQTLYNNYDLDCKTIPTGIVTRCIDFSNNAQDAISGQSGQSEGSSLLFVSDKNTNTTSALNLMGHPEEAVSYSVEQSSLAPYWTVSLWTKPASSTVVGPYSYFLSSIGSGGGDQSISISNVAVNVNNYTAFGSVYSVSSGILPISFADSWHHIVGVKKMDTLALYIDGQRVAYRSSVPGYSFYGAAATLSVISETVGMRYDGGSVYDGMIDQFRRYNYPLSNAAIQELYTGYNKNCDGSITAIDEPKKDRSSQAGIYPNPAKDMIYIDASAERIEIVNAIGMSVLKTTNNNSINVSELNSGIYFITIKTDSGSHTQKVIKE